jgi:hypothetical protein
MKIERKVKGYVIAKLSEKEQEQYGFLYHLYTVDEYSYGNGYRTHEFEADTIDELIDFIG